MSKNYADEIVQGIKEHVAIINVKRERLQNERIIIRENEEAIKRARETIVKLEDLKVRKDKIILEINNEIKELEEDVWKRMKELREESMDGNDSSNPLINNGKTVEEIYEEMINFLKENHKRKRINKEEFNNKIRKIVKENLKKMSINEFNYQKYIKFERTIRDNGEVICSMVLYSENIIEIQEFNVEGGVIQGKNNRYGIDMYYGYKRISELDFGIIAVSGDIEGIVRRNDNQMIISYEYKWNKSNRDIVVQEIINEYKKK